MTKDIKLSIDSTGQTVLIDKKYSFMKIDLYYLITDPNCKTAQGKQINNMWYNDNYYMILKESKAGNKYLKIMLAPNNKPIYGIVDIQQLFPIVNTYKESLKQFGKCKF